MAELKWSNVNGSDITNALEVYQRASNTMFDRTTNLVNGLQNHLGNMQRGKESEYNHQKEMNTQDVLNQLANSDSLGDLDSMVQLADANALRERYGTQIDMSKINQAKSTLAKDTYDRANSKDSLLDYDPQAKEVLNQYYQLMASGKPEEATKLVANSNLSNKTKNTIFETGLQQLNSDRAYNTQQRDTALKIGSDIRKAEMDYMNAQSAIDQFEANLDARGIIDKSNFYKQPEYQKLILARDQAKANYDSIYGTYAPTFEQITGTKYKGLIGEMSGSPQQPTEPRQVNPNEVQSVQQGLQNPQQNTIDPTAIQAGLQGVNSVYNTLGSTNEVVLSQKTLEANNRQKQQNNFVQNIVPRTDSLYREVMSDPAFADAYNGYKAIISGEAKDTDIRKTMSDPNFLAMLEKAGWHRDTIASVANGTISPQSLRAKLKETSDFFNSGEIKNNLYSSVLYKDNLFTGENKADVSRDLTDVTSNLGSSTVYNSKFAKGISFNSINKESNRDATYRQFKKTLPYLSQGDWDDTILEAWFEDGLKRGFEPTYLVASLETVIQRAMERTGTESPKDVLAGIFDYSYGNKTSNDYNSLERLTKDINPNLLRDTLDRGRELNRQLEEGKDFLALQVLGGSLISKDKNGNYTGLPMTGSENISKLIDDKWGLAGNSIHSNAGTERARETANLIQKQLNKKNEDYQSISSKYFDHSNKNYDSSLSDEERQILRAEELNRLESQEVNDLPVLRELKKQAKEDLMNMSKGGSLGNTKKELEKSLAEVEKKIKEIEKRNNPSK